MHPAIAEVGPRSCFRGSGLLGMKDGIFWINDCLRWLEKRWRSLAGESIGIEKGNPAGTESEEIVAQ